MSSDKPDKRVLSKAETRKKVVAAAQKLFVSRGYEPTTMRDIAVEAGMSTGAIFVSFASKAALYEDIYGHAPVTAEQGREFLIALTMIRSCVTRDGAVAIAAEAVKKWGFK